MEKIQLNIIQNAGRLYMRYGIRSVTMDDVARELGISKKTLYKYFKNKEKLVSAVLDFYMENPDFNLNDEKNGNPIDRVFALRDHVANIIKAYNNNLEFDLRKNYPALYKKIRKFKREKIFSDTVKNIDDGKEQGLFREDTDTEFVAKLNVGRMLFCLNPENDIFSEAELSSIELFDKTIDYHLRGICTEKGLKYYKEQLNRIQNEK